MRRPVLRSSEVDRNNCTAKSQSPRPERHGRRHRICARRHQWPVPPSDGRPLTPARATARSRNSPRDCPCIIARLPQGRPALMLRRCSWAMRSTRSIPRAQSRAQNHGEKYGRPQRLLKFGPSTTALRRCGSGQVAKVDVDKAELTRRRDGFTVPVAVISIPRATSGRRHRARPLVRSSQDQVPLKKVVPSSRHRSTISNRLQGRIFVSTWAATASGGRFLENRRCQQLIIGSWRCTAASRRPSDGDKDRLTGRVLLLPHRRWKNRRGRRTCAHACRLCHAVISDERDGKGHDVLRQACSPHGAR